jgi:hypothetical protein
MTPEEESVLAWWRRSGFCVPSKADATLELAGLEGHIDSA